MTQAYQEVENPNNNSASPNGLWASLASVPKKNAFKIVIKCLVAILLLGGLYHVFTLQAAKQELSVVEAEEGQDGQEEHVEIIHSYYPADSEYRPTDDPKIIKTIFTEDDMKYEKVTYHNTRVSNDGKAPTVLFMASVANEHAFGPNRSLKDFISLINSLNYKKELISIGILCATDAARVDGESFFDELMELEVDFQFARVTLITENFMGKAFGRHDSTPSVQRPRRRMIAKARNFALFNSLQDERYVMYIDVDVWRFDNTDMLDRFIRLGRDIIVPRIARLEQQNDYDLNTWNWPRAHPLPEQMELMKQDKWDEAGFVAGDSAETYHLHDELDRIDKLPQDAPERSLDYAYEVDSVGGAVLFAKSIVYKQGIVFPPLYIVGTEWDRLEGYDGMETEGLCYMAKALNYKCWGMPNLVAQHAV